MSDIAVTTRTLVLGATRPSSLRKDQPPPGGHICWPIVVKIVEVWDEAGSGTPELSTGTAVGAPDVDAPGNPAKKRRWGPITQVARNGLCRILPVVV